MTEQIYQAGECYNYPLIIKKLLKDSLIKSPDREIVYSDRHRYTYRDLNQRIARLADGLTGLGASAGDTIAVFDYDSHRYLECFFAIPMIGAVLQTVNWRLSAEQIAYTLNHAEAKIIIINADFLPILEDIHSRLETVQTVVTIAENGATADTKIGTAAEFENLVQDASTSFDFPDLDENTKATTFYTTGTTGNPKGVHFSYYRFLTNQFRGERHQFQPVFSPGHPHPACNNARFHMEKSWANHSLIRPNGQAGLLMDQLGQIE